MQLVAFVAARNGTSQSSRVCSMKGAPFSKGQDKDHSLDEENPKDFTSRLPNQILARIVLSLPLETATALSLLSTQWRDLWNARLIQHGTVVGITEAIFKFCDQIDESDPLSNPLTLEYHLDYISFVLPVFGASQKVHMDFSFVKEEFPSL
ncbi:hypothetical protein Ancab_001481 [Ancistrocladus abbreviatus]